MRKFVVKYLFRMLIEAGIPAAVVTVLVQMSFDGIAIEHDKNMLLQIIIIPLAAAAFVSFFTMFMAKHNTNVLRRYEYSLGEGRERAFYAVFAVVLILLTAADILFLLSKSRPFFDKALAYAIKDAQIRNETAEIEKQMITDLNDKYSLYISAERFAALVSLLLSAAVYIRSAGKLVLEYRDPPDYWSGKKRSKKRKR